MEGESKNEILLDIHGREVPIVNVGVENTPACFLSDVKQTGVVIFHKDNFQKVALMDKEFDGEFSDYMLEAAKSYMMANKRIFTEKQIISSINNCKEILSTTEKLPTEAKMNFLKTRHVEVTSKNEDDIQISITNNTTPTTPKPPKHPFIRSKPSPSPLSYTTESSSDAESSHSGKKIDIRKFLQKGFQNKRLSEPAQNYNQKIDSTKENSFQNKRLSEPLQNYNRKIGNKTRENSFQNNSSREALQDHDQKIENRREKSFQKKSLSESPQNYDQKSENRREKSFQNKGLSEAPQNHNKNTAREKRITYNITSQNMDVIVTSIDKSNCVWVRETAKSGLFNQVQQKINSEADRCTKTKDCLEIHNLYVAQDGNVWFRCKLLKTSPITVFFLDYGNVAQVPELRDLSVELSQIEPLAFRITFKELQYKLQLEDEVTIRAFHKNADGTVFVNILGGPKSQTKPLKHDFKETKDNDFKEVKEDSYNEPKENGVKEAAENSFEEVKEKTFFNKPKPYNTLQHDQKVVIWNVINDIFYLKTKEDFQLQQKIEREINNFLKDAKNLTEVQENQLVLYQNKDKNKIYRGCVIKIDEELVQIEFLDFVKVFWVELSDLLSINEFLSSQPMTYFSGGKLQSFEDKSFNSNQNRILKDFIDAKKKFTVILGFDDELDLMYEGGLMLSEQLAIPKEPIIKTKIEPVIKTKITIDTPKFLTLKDMQTFKPNMGSNSYVCGCFVSSTNLTLVPSDELTKNIDYILRVKLEDEKEYVPNDGEICLCYFVDSWYRCLILKSLPKEYEVLLLDFGNIELIIKKDIRKADSNVTKAPTLALPCKLKDLPQIKDVEVFLKQILIEGEVYNVQFVSLESGKYLVEIPSLYKKLREL